MSERIHLDEADQSYLLSVAREEMTAFLEHRPARDPEAAHSSTLRSKRGCFVTIHKQGRLRGCIGTIEPVKPLIEGVRENAVNAAFKDPRFNPLTRSELPGIDIEISVLTQPRKLVYTSPEELLDQLEAGVDGVILSKGWHRSTFLPQVWQQLPDKKAFLSNLCRKGGMDAGCWRQMDIDVEIYRVSVFAERHR